MCLRASQVVLVVKNPSASAGDTREAGSIPGSGRSPGEGNGNPFHYSCLENPMDRRAWWAAVHGVAKSQTWLSDRTTRASLGFPGGTSGKEPICQCRRLKRRGFDPWVGKIPWRRAWQATPVFLPGESHGQRSLAGYSPGACKRVRHNLAIKEQEPEMVKGTIKGYWSTLKLAASDITEHTAHDMVRQLSSKIII